MNAAYDIRSFPEPIGAALVERLAQAETATIGHARLHGFLDSSIRPVIADRRIAGTAVTLRIPGADSTLLHHALGHVRAGDILMIDRCGDDLHACWGGSLTVAARARKLAGAVIDGRATDFGDIRRIGFPVWCRGPSPITTRLLAAGGGLNVPVTVGGVVVNPGDAVIADDNGVVVLAPGEAELWASYALDEQSEEIPFNEALERGERLGVLSGATAMIEEATGLDLGGDEGT